MTDPRDGCKSFMFAHYGAISANFERELARKRIRDFYGEGNAASWRENSLHSRLKDFMIYCCTRCTANKNAFRMCACLTCIYNSVKRSSSLYRCQPQRPLRNRNGWECSNTIILSRVKEDSIAFVKTEDAALSFIIHKQVHYKREKNFDQELEHF